MSELPVIQTIHEVICGIENSAKRIVGGTTLLHHKYPWTAYIVGRGNKGWKQCGGTIINDRYIMTAAHCLLGLRQIRVAVGYFKVPLLFHYFNWMFPSFDGFLKTSGVLFHPDFNETYYYSDLALLRLNDRLEYTNNVRPVCLPSNSSLSGQMIVTGWGKTEIKETSRAMVETVISEYPFDQCNEEWDGTLDETQFCAAEVGRDACVGDSGGPITKIIKGRYYVVGIVSFGVATVCGVERNSVHTRVAPFVEWIKEQTKSARSCNE
ncbi:seminal fluid protein-like protein [Leptotrombidium deliense]|uniref:Seminal fluid protein-like protein n=1 Tax=Leptotrombidium deliense TaxID=299467 RepID=A0A443SHK0_9ACAR|nr:seminal fluid protein-like protein [Leptotrombidium deliense]